jgi:hypothetical protein
MRFSFNFIFVLVGATILIDNQNFVAINAFMRDLIAAFKVTIAK